MNLIEIHKIAQWKISQPEIADELGLVDRQQLINRLYFQNNSIFHQDIQTKSRVQNKSLILNRHYALCFHSQAPLAKLVHQTRFIHAFQKAGAQMAMYLYCGANDGLTQLYQAFLLSSCPHCSIFLLNWM